MLGLAALVGQTPSAPAQQPPPTADPYANNAEPGATQFPLAAPAGKDSSARMVAPAGAVNQGPFDPATWKYGTAFNPPAGSKIWNPVKLKMMQGGKVTGGTVFSATDPATYCAMANAGYDFIWTEMQHNDRDWEAVARMWRTCPNAKAVPGVRVAYTDEREIQHALDAGALVIVVPTVDSKAEAIEARNWTYFPPLGRRSNGGGQAFDAGMWGGVPGGYRNTINDNVVLIEMIETLDGLKDADEIAKVPGVDRGVRGQRRPRQLLRLSAGHARLRARDQHRPRRGDQGGQAAVRSVRVARPSGLHLLPGGQRDRRDRARRRAPSSATWKHAGQAGSRPVRGAGETVEIPDVHTRFTVVAGALLLVTGLALAAVAAPQKTAAPVVVYKSPT